MKIILKEAGEKPLIMNMQGPFYVNPLADKNIKDGVSPTWDNSFPHLDSKNAIEQVYVERHPDGWYVETNYKDSYLLAKAVMDATFNYTGDLYPSLLSVEYGAIPTSEAISNLEVHNIDEDLAENSNEPINYKEEVINTVAKEFDAFKARLLTQSAATVFYENYQIYVKSEIKEFLLTADEDYELQPKYYEALYQEKGHILDSLFDTFVSYDWSSVNNFDDIQEYIEQYCEDYYSEIINGSDEAETNEDENDEEELDDEAADEEEMYLEEDAEPDTEEEAEPEETDTYSETEAKPKDNNVNIKVGDTVDYHNADEVRKDIAEDVLLTIMGSRIPNKYGTFSPEWEVLQEVLSDINALITEKYDLDKGDNESEKVEEPYEYQNKETGELLTEAEMQKQFEEEYDGSDPTNPVSIDEYYEKLSENGILDNSNSTMSDIKEDKTMEINKNYTPIYYKNAREAYKNGADSEDAKAYRESNQATKDLLIDFNKMINDHTRVPDNGIGVYIDKNIVAKDLIEKYGIERVKYVCATIIQNHPLDGRYSRENKEWAKTIQLSESEDVRNNIYTQVHPTVVDSFTDTVKQIEKENLIKNKDIKTIILPENAKVKELDNITIFRMPNDGKYIGFTYAIPTDVISAENSDSGKVFKFDCAPDNSVLLRYFDENGVEDVVVTTDLKGWEYALAVEGKSEKDYIYNLEENKMAEEQQTNKYLTETSRGDKVVDITKDKYGRDAERFSDGQYEGTPDYLESYELRELAKIQRQNLN